MRKVVYIFLMVLPILAGIFDAGAQNPRRSRHTAVKVENIPLDDPLEQLDSAALARLDSIRVFKDSVARRDSLFRVDSLASLENSSLKAPAFSSAGDSIVEVFTEGKRVAYYYGGVSVKYDDMTLEADYMEYDMNTGTVYAKGRYDSLAGEWIGRPVMKQGGSDYEMDEVKYNFNTKKAFIKNMVTSDQEGDLQGDQILMTEDKSISLMGGKYTVCDAEEPHYYLALKEAKVITQPTKKVVFGPAHPVIGGVDFPIYLPFGFVPDRPEKASGILFPTIGEEEARGFCLRDGGVYFVFGNNVDLALTGTIYSLGSWGVNLNSNYAFRYKCSGSVGLTFSNDFEGEKGSPTYSPSTNFRVKWSHQQDSKAHPGTTFSASVDLSSARNNRYNTQSIDFQEAMNNTTSSSISYSRNWNGKFNLSIAASHSQSTRDTTNASYTVGLPNINFSMSTIYPFKRKHRVGPEKAYEKISFGYNTSFDNKTTFTTNEVKMGGIDTVLNNMQNGMRHNFSIGLPSFQLPGRVGKFITFNPSISYGMNMYFSSNEQYYNPETGRIETEQSKAFSDFGISQTGSLSGSLSTRIYGMFNFGKHNKVQAIRHIITPSLSFSLSPDTRTAGNGWRTLEYVDTNQVAHTYQYNIYSKQLNSPSGSGKSGSLNFSFGNNIEAKVRDLNDTTGKGNKKVKLVDQLTIAGSYNFFADSLNLSNININASTSILEGKMHIQGNMSLDPYAIDDYGKTYNRYSIAAGQGLVRLRSASASLSYSLSGDGAMKGNDGSKLAGGGGGNSGASSYYQVFYHPVTGEYIPGGWLYYINPVAPWSLSFNYSLNYSPKYSNPGTGLVTTHDITQTLGINGQFKPTPRMSLTFNTGFDFTNMKVSPTNINFTYDLHCFNITFSWVPFGSLKSYQFRIAANAASLADLLKLEKGRSRFDYR